MLLPSTPSRQGEGQHEEGWELEGEEPSTSCSSSAHRETSWGRVRGQRAITTFNLSLELRPPSSISRKEEGIKSSHLPSPIPRACPEVCAQWFPSPSQPNPRDSAVWVPNKMHLCRDRNKEIRGRGAGSYYLLGTEFRFYKKSSGARWFPNTVKSIVTKQDT